MMVIVVNGSFGLRPSVWGLVPFEAPEGPSALLSEDAEALDPSVESLRR